MDRLYVCTGSRSRSKKSMPSVCVRESAPEVLLLLGRLHSTQSEVDPAPQPSRLVELGWLWRSFLKTSMGVGWAEWVLTPLYVGLLESSPPSTPGADLMCLQSRVSTWVPQAMGSILEAQGLQLSESSVSPAPLLGAVKPVIDR